MAQRTAATALASADADGYSYAMNEDGTYSQANAFSTYSFADRSNGGYDVATQDDGYYFAMSDHGDEGGYDSRTVPSELVNHDYDSASAVSTLEPEYERMDRAAFNEEQLYTVNVPKMIPPTPPPLPVRPAMVPPASSGGDFELELAQLATGMEPTAHHSGLRLRTPSPKLARR